MKIAISGASGFVGMHLSDYLRSQGHEIVPLGRAELADGAQKRLAELVAPCDAVINLAGAPIDHRWTRRYKNELWESRIATTRRLVGAVNAGSCVKTFISTSAVGAYPSVGCYDESDDVRGNGFLARLCEMWEAEAEQVDARCAITRFGVVLAGDGGAFQKLARPAQRGVAVIPGSGAQAFSWIALDDLVRAEEFLLSNTGLSGVFNLVAPGTTTMRGVVEAAAAHYRSWLTVRIPSFAVRWAMGEAAGFILDGPCVRPHRLLGAGFRFEVPTIGDFLQNR